MHLQYSLQLYGYSQIHNRDLPGHLSAIYRNSSEISEVDFINITSYCSHWLVFSIAVCQSMCL